MVKNRLGVRETGNSRDLAGRCSNGTHKGCEKARRCASADENQKLARGIGQDALLSISYTGTKPMPVPWRTGARVASLSQTAGAPTC